MKCAIHDCEMEWWVPFEDDYIFPEGGLWICNDCDAEEIHEQDDSDICDFGD